MYEIHQRNGGLGHASRRLEEIHQSVGGVTSSRRIPAEIRYSFAQDFLAKGPCSWNWIVELF